MTPEQHNKYLSWAHFAHAGFTIALMLLMMVFMTTIMTVDPKPPPPAFIAIMWVFIGGMTAVMVGPSIVAGYALRKKKRWAKTMSIVAGVMASMSAPIGTAVCVYTFWFLFSEPGKILYDNPQRLLPQQGKKEIKEAQYVPPASPPDWR